MSHFAVISPPFTSHLRALQALAQQLILRGHRVTFILPPQVQGQLSEPRIGVHSPGEASRDAATLARLLHHAAHPDGLAVLRLIGDMAGYSDMLCRQLPGVLERLAVDGLIVDEMEPAGALVADALGIPFVSVACALPLNREPGIPLPVMPFAWADDARAQRLYQGSLKVHDWMMRGHSRVLNRHARRFGLAPRQGLHDCLSTRAQISQIVPGLDFPRRELPAGYYAVGPLRSARPAPEAARPFTADRPLVYASLGTLQGHRFRLFKTLTRACREVNARLLIAHCGRLNAVQEQALRDMGADEVTGFTDQQAVLQQAQAVITHGGMNTVADAVATLTPVLAIPLAFDQPGVAARVAWSGIGLRASRFSSPRTLSTRLEMLLGDESYKTRLAELQRSLQQAGGAVRAAAIVEQALGTPAVSPPEVPCHSGI